MSYSRNFTIGLREVQGLNQMLALEGGWKGIVGIGLAVALINILYMSKLDLGTAAALLILVAPPAMVVAALALIVWTRLRTRRELQRTGKGSYIQETEISGFGVRVTVGKTRAKLSFGQLVRVRETRKAFYLFVSGNQAWILPKAQMEDQAAECGTLRQIFRTVVERKKLQLKR